MLRKENAMAGRACEWEGGSEESGRVAGIAPRHPPTLPDVRFSASGD